MLSFPFTRFISQRNTDSLRITRYPLPPPHPTITHTGTPRSLDLTRLHRSGPPCTAHACRGLDRHATLAAISHPTCSPRTEKATSARRTWGVTIKALKPSMLIPQTHVHQHCGKVGVGSKELRLLRWSWRVIARAVTACLGDGNHQGLRRPSERSVSHMH
jgi:hypothetical protein